MPYHAISGLIGGQLRKRIGHRSRQIFPSLTPTVTLGKLHRARRTESACVS